MKINKNLHSIPLKTKMFYDKIYSMDILAKLNEEQIQPVKETEGPVLVIAGAGSGKTRVLTSRIAYLVQEKNVAPRNILAITFTNKAANEMKERLSKIIENSGDMWVCTIHSMCVKILRENISRLNPVYNSNFTIYDDGDTQKVIKRLCAEKNYDEEFAKKVRFHISNAKNKAQGPAEYFQENAEERHMDKICDIFTKYDETLQKSNALDFDDLLVKTYELLSVDKETLDYYSNRFRYIHVDEFQDTNKVQFMVINLLSTVHNNLFVVGDDDQSIYGWRGAEIKNILEFSKRFAGAKTFKLERNYRSTKKILELANLIIKNNTFRNDKTLWTDNDEGAKVETFIAGDEMDEAMYTAVQIKSMLSRYPQLKASDFAVLMRVNAVSRAYEQEFTKYGIPYRIYGGFKFYERKEIKDALAYLKILNNPLDDEAVLRIINVPKRGIGDKSINALIEYAERYGLSIFDAIFECDRLDLNKGAINKLNEFANLIRALIVDKEVLTLPELAESVLDKTGLKLSYEGDSDESTSKRMNLDELHNSITEFYKANAGANLSDYLNSVTLSTDIDNIAEDDAVTIATIHAVKGLEFRCVFVCALEESIFPISRAAADNDELEEERRLMYVAITRARDRLYLTRSKSRFLYGDRAYMPESRFLKELKPILKPERAVEEKPTYGKALFDKSDDLGYSTKHGTGYSSSYASEYLKRAEQTKKAAATSSAYKSGIMVKHAKFGVGTVITVKGSGDNIIVDVAFKGIGVKSLSARFAPMEIIG